MTSQAQSHPLAYRRSGVIRLTDGSECSSSVKGCDCSAHIRAQMHPKYAKEAGEWNSILDSAEAVEYSTAVFVTIQPTHKDHDPEQDSFLDMSYLDERVKGKISELAEHLMLPSEFIWHESRRFASTITSGLSEVVETNTSRFFPSLPTVRRLVRRRREGLRLDPDDHVAVQKYIEEDQTNCPGKCETLTGNTLVHSGVEAHP